MLTQSLAAGEVPSPNATSHHRYESGAAGQVRRMADVLIANQKDGRATSWGDLIAARFSPAQIGALFPEAAAIANRSTFRRIEDEFEDPTEADLVAAADRSVAEQMAAVIVAGLSRNKSAIASLQQAGRWTGTEIALHLDEANRLVDKRLRAVAPPNRSLVNLAHSLGRMVQQLQAEGV